CGLRAAPQPPPPRPGPTKKPPHRVFFFFSGKPLVAALHHKVKSLDRFQETLHRLPVSFKNITQPTINTNCIKPWAPEQ
ncbi:hypothetical protein, partial [Enterobacter asburiae]